jgi:NAD(P)-dependent dehydrogenase (short-subunit alcohol dehydrogenase family)
MSQQFPDVQFLSVATDISDSKSIENLFSIVKDKFGHADVIINNAAALRAVGPVKDVDASTWWSDFVCKSMLLAQYYTDP